MPRTYPKKKAPRRGLMPIAARLAIAGELLLAAAVCDFAARLNIARLAGASGALLRLSDFGGSLGSAAVILTAAVLYLDYLERQAAG